MLMEKIVFAADLSGFEYLKIGKGGPKVEREVTDYLQLSLQLRC